MSVMLDANCFLFLMTSETTDSDSATSVPALKRFKFLVDDNWITSTQLNK